MDDFQILLAYLVGGVAVVAIIVIALARSSYFMSQRYRDAGFHRAVVRPNHSDGGIHGDVVIVPDRRRS